MCEPILICEDDDSGVPTEHLTPPPSGCTGLILLQLGTFSPPSVSHVRLLLSAYETVRARLNSDEIISGAYVSPVGCQYNKMSARSIKWEHRVNMCYLAFRSVQWAEVSSWEAKQGKFTRSHIVVSHILSNLSKTFPGCIFSVYIVCGQDLRVGMRDRSKWPLESVRCLQQKVKGFIVKRRTDGDAPSPEEEDNEDDVWIEGWVGNLSSTQIRETIQDGRSIHLMAPQAVENYISTHQLYRKEENKSKREALTDTRN